MEQNALERCVRLSHVLLGGLLVVPMAIAQAPAANLSLKSDAPMAQDASPEGGPILKVADPTEDLNTGNSGSGGQRTLKFTSMSMPDFALNLNFYEDPGSNPAHLLERPLAGQFPAARID
jgi:hypothetical protein